MAVSRLVRSALLAGVMASLGACSLLATFDGLVGAENRDAGPQLDPTYTDAVAPGDASSGVEASSDAGTDGGADSGSDSSLGAVIFSADFEQGCDNSFGYYQANLSTSTTAHGGSKSCMVCYDTGGMFYTADGQLPLPAGMPGQAFHAEAWVRNAGPVAQQSGMAIRIYDSPPFMAREQSGFALSTIDGSWRLLTVDYAPTKSAGSWDFFVGTAEPDGGANAGDCFLLDDIVVRRLR